MEIMGCFESADRPGSYATGQHSVASLVPSIQRASDGDIGNVPDRTVKLFIQITSLAPLPTMIPYSRLACPSSRSNADTAHPIHHPS
jgi:hypothetical protein